MEISPDVGWLFLSCKGEVISMWREKADKDYWNNFATVTLQDTGIDITNIEQFDKCPAFNNV